MKCGKLIICWVLLNKKLKQGRLVKGQGSNHMSDQIPHQILTILQLVHLSQMVLAYNAFTVKGNTTQPHVIRSRMSRSERIFCLRVVDASTV